MMRRIYAGRAERYARVMRPLAFVAALLLATSAHAADPASPPQPSSPTTQAAGYMAGVASQPGVVVTGSGLAYKVLRAGPADGVSPRLGDRVRVSYEGRLVNGTVFDSSASAGGPVVLTVGQLVPGWDEALQLMHPGDEWTLYVPPSLGYGDQASGPIPANSVMVFRLQLLSVIPPGAD